MRRRVVATGYGVVSPIGSDIETFQRSLLNGESGIDFIKNHDIENEPIKIAGEIKDYFPKEHFSHRELRHIDRFSQLALVATEMAVEKAKLKEDESLLHKACVFMGTGIGGIGAIDRLYDQIVKNEKPEAYGIPKIMNNAAAGLIAARFKANGGNFTVNTACSSGSNAIGLAYRAIQNEHSMTAICGGTEAPLSPKLLRAWNSLRVLNTKFTSPQTACRPFNKSRNGFVMSEGAGILILEELGQAQRRGARILGEIIGYACVGGGAHPTAPELNSQVLCLEEALESSKLEAKDIDYISAHGTGTAVNDKLEVDTLKQVFGHHIQEIPISSIKSMLGHSMGASSALEAVACILNLEKGFIPPTVNYEEENIEFNLDFVPNQSREAELNVIMSNSFAFGGNNSCLIFSNLEKFAEEQTPSL